MKYGNFKTDVEEQVKLFIMEIAENKTMVDYMYAKGIIYGIGQTYCLYGEDVIDQETGEVLMEVIQKVFDFLEIESTIMLKEVEEIWKT